MAKSLSVTKKKIRQEADFLLFLKETEGISVSIHIHLEGSWGFWKAWHGHDFSGQGNNEACAQFWYQLADGNVKASWSPKKAWII